MGPPARGYASEVTLPDGRTLAYAEYGDQDGSPVLHFHGTPGSRVAASITRESMASRGVRLVAPDRPGIGRSDPDPGRTFADWVDDVAALTDALGIEEYGVVGVSSGGPYALACAAHMPARVTRCAVVSGYAPPGVVDDDLPRFERTIRSLTRRSVHLGRPLVWLLRRQVRDADSFTDVVGDPKDGDLSDPRFGETGRILLSNYREALRQGSLPVAEDYRVVARPWDFELLDVGAPTRVFHGSADETIPLAAGEHVASHVPGSELVVYDGEGHLRPAVEHAEEIHEWAAGRDKESNDGETSRGRSKQRATDD